MEVLSSPITLGDKLMPQRRQLVIIYLFPSTLICRHLAAI